MTYTDLKLFDSFLFLVKQANVDTVAPFIHWMDDITTGFHLHIDNNKNLFFIKLRKTNR
jgi:hypothetical protein